MLLILAGVSIATLTGENGILTRAQDAKTNTEIAEEKEAIGLAYNGVMAENKGNGVSSGELEIELHNNGRTDAHATGENPITVTFDSGRSYTVDSNGNISNPTVSNIVATMEVVGVEKTEEEVINDIPDGFHYVEGTHIDSGLVISSVEGDDLNNSAEGNQFVWVPVDKDQKLKISVKTEENIESIKLKTPYGDEQELEKTDYQEINLTGNENYINGPYVLKVNTATEEKTTILGVHSLYAKDTTADWFFTEEVALAQGASSLEELLMGFTLEEAYVEYAKMLDEYEESNDNEDIGLNDKESVEENGGFYIGRYEASYESGKVASKESTRIDREYNEIPENGMLWNYVSQIDALEKSKEMYSGMSTLLTGAAWDRTLGWLEETGAVTSFEIVADSSTWGNYSDDEFSNTTGLINTGECGETKRNNIYDLAGNLWEWTTEADNTNNRVGRGR